MARLFATFFRLAVLLAVVVVKVEQFYYKKKTFHVESNCGLLQIVPNTKCARYIKRCGIRNSLFDKYPVYYRAVIL